MGCDARAPEVRFSLVSEFSLSNAYLVSQFLLYDINTRWVEKVMLAQLTAVGFSDVTFFPGSLVAGEALRGFIAVSPELVYVHVKGTTGNFGWLQNAKATTWSASDLFPNSGWQHTGFRDYYRALMDRWNFESRLRELTKGKKPLLFSGHSQGAAIALLAAARARQNGENVLALYNSGQPRAGDANFTRRLSTILKGRWHRMRFDNDVVPHLPPTSGAGAAFNTAVGKLTSFGLPLTAIFSLTHYAHGAGIVLSPDGTATNEVEQDDVAADTAFWLRAGLSEGAPGALSAKRVTDDHYPEKYHCALARALLRAHN